MNIPEILAPAGNMDALRAAVYAGCDAVYLGGERFGARAYAGNFTETELLEGIRFAHLYGVKVYLTVNTLFRNEEIKQLYLYLLPLYEAGLDAVIVQDYGVMEYVHLQFPDLPIHASTQMTVTTGYAYNILKDYGVTRIVPARELSIEEIRGLKNDKNIPEVEVFVQGALCVCYSGQCFMSSFLGGRSGNRGRCAGSCRLPYSIFDSEGKAIYTDGEYLLSLKDLCGLESIPQLMDAGVDSFKIEGRMKKPEYVAACVRSYRKCVDAFIELSKQSMNDLTDSYYRVVDECREDMAAIFNRGGFTSGYYNKHNGRDMMSFDAPGNIGIIIGTIIDIQKNTITVKLKKDVHKGDIFLINGNDVTLTCNVDSYSGSDITLNVPRAKELSCGFNVSRVYDFQQNDQLRAIIDTDKNILLKGHAEFHKGRRASLHLSACIGGTDISVNVKGEIVEPADAAPINEGTIREKISMLGNTRYSFDELTVVADDGIFYPIKGLKDIRRAGLSELENSIIKQYMRRLDIDEINPEDIIKIDRYTEAYNQTDKLNENWGIDIIVSDKQQLECCEHLPEIDRIYVDLQFFDKRDIITFMKNRPEYGYVLPPIMRSPVIDELNDLPLVSCASIIVRNIDELAYLKFIGYKGEIVADYTLYAMNDLAARFLYKVYDNIRITFPVELNREQIHSLCYADDIGVLNVYGYQPLMIMAQCFNSNIHGCNHKSERYLLKDRKNQRFLIRNICKYCYNILYNSVPTVISDSEYSVSNHRVRFHFTNESPSEVLEVINTYIHSGEFKTAKTTGHFRRGVE